MASYVEQPQRAKGSKLLGVLGFKAQSKNSFGQQSRVGSNNAQQDSVKAVQDRLLHKALHNRGPVYYTAYSSKPKTSKTSMQQYNNVKPPRGTLSDDKLPYLDWRLSLLLLQQVQSDAPTKVDVEESLSKAFRNSNKIADQDARNYHQSNTNIIEVLTREKDRISLFNDSGSGSDSGSDMSSKQGLHTLAYQSTAIYPRSDVWLSPSAPLHVVPESDFDNDPYTNSTLHQTMLTNDALAAIPLLEREARFLSPGSGNDEEESNEQFYDVDESLDKRVTKDEHQPAPAPLLPASIFHRANFGIQSNSMERTSSRNKMPKLFTRNSNGNTRPPLPSRSQSHGCLPTSSKADVAGSVKVSNLYYNQVKPKKKWSLLALHNLGGSEILTRESDLMC